MAPPIVEKGYQLGLLSKVLKRASACIRPLDEASVLRVSNFAYVNVAEWIMKNSKASLGYAYWNIFIE